MDTTERLLNKGKLNVSREGVCVSLYSMTNQSIITLPWNGNRISNSEYTSIGEEKTCLQTLHVRRLHYSQRLAVDSFGSDTSVYYLCSKPLIVEIGARIFI